MNPKTHRAIRWFKMRGVVCSFVLSLMVVFSALGQASVHRLQDGESAADWSVLLPEGDGRAEVILSCSSCHDLRQVLRQKKSKSNWGRTVQKMVATYQAPVDYRDVATIIDYLAKSFGENNPLEQLPMDVNTASVEALARLPGLNPDLARSIVECRQTNGLFASVEDLSRVKGIDESTLERIKPYLVTSNGK